jgi:GNAT superfamily N-acetyltransferase
MMNIRRFQDEDAKPVSDLVALALREVNSRDYPSATIESTVVHFSPENVAKMSCGRQMHVAEKDGDIVATGSVAKEWILSFFVHPRHHGQGIGTLLLRHLEQVIQHAGHSHALIPAGHTALTFYERNGYRKAEDQSKASKDWVIVEKVFDQYGAPNQASEAIALQGGAIASTLTFDERMKETP